MIWRTHSSQFFTRTPPAKNPKVKKIFREEIHLEGQGQNAANPQGESALVQTRRPKQMTTRWAQRRMCPNPDCTIKRRNLGLESQIGAVQSQVVTKKHKTKPKKQNWGGRRTTGKGERDEMLKEQVRRKRTTGRENRERIRNRGCKKGSNEHICA